VAFAALFGRWPTDLAVVSDVARYFSQEDATRPRRTQLTYGKPTRITDEKSGDSRLLKVSFNSLRPHSCLSRGGREVQERSQFSRRVLRTKAKSSRFFEASQHPAKKLTAAVEE
jgi:hypothetical protein